MDVRLIDSGKKQGGFKNFRYLDVSLRRLNSDLDLLEACGWTVKDMPSRSTTNQTNPMQNPDVDDTEGSPSDWMSCVSSKILIIFSRSKFMFSSTLYQRGCAGQ
eukprot:scaffold8212_cov93-Cylindrotheca_fusiformis.AAC.7